MTEQGIQKIIIGEGFGGYQILEGSSDRLGIV